MTDFVQETREAFTTNTVPKNHVSPLIDENYASRPLAQSEYVSSEFFKEQKAIEQQIKQDIIKENHQNNLKIIQ